MNMNINKGWLSQLKSYQCCQQKLGLATLSLHVWSIVLKSGINYVKQYAEMGEKLSTLL